MSSTYTVMIRNVLGENTRTKKNHCFFLSFRWEQFDKNYLSKLLLRKSVYHKSELWEAYQKINIRDAISVIDQVKVLM